MANIVAIRDQLKTNLQTIAALQTYDTMPNMPIVPCAIVSPAPGVFLAEVSMDGVEDVDFVVLVLTEKIVAESAQDYADTKLSAGSSNVANAIDSGDGTYWDYAVAMPVRGYGQYVFGEGEGAQRYLGFEIPVRVGVS